MHPRTRTLAAATLVALCSGTNYVFSAYAPQLAARCGLSSTQLNLVGIAGNLGVYTSGPVWGVFIDRNGPRGVLACAAACIAVGYAGIRWLYVHSPVRVSEAARADTRTVALLCVCMLLTGYAASAGLNASLNTVARSFPSSSRATASGITLAGFGLSAFFFSSLAHAVFPGRTDAFLALLAIGTAAGMLVGVVAVRTVPVVDEEEEEGYVPVHQDDEAGYVDIDTPAAVNAEPVLAEDDDYLTHPLHRSHNHTHYEDSVPLTVSRSRSTDLVRPSIDDTLPRSRSSLDRQDGANEPPCVPLLLPPAEKPLLGKAVTGQVSGRQLLSSADFWTIVAILTLLSGTGLMYINNVGSVVLALANHPPSLLDTFPDPREVAKVQARQVSVISIWNCLGRIIMGLVSDFAKTRYGVNRVWFTLAIALLFLASQLSVQMTTDMYALSLVSALLGSAYGMLFALLPILVLEWFGLANFSMNWGIVSLAPGLGGNVANLIFGRVYDSNVTAAEATERIVRRMVRLFARGGAIPDPSDHTHDCLLGSGCYATAFRVTTVWCCMALVLGLFAAVKHERKSRAERRRGLQKRKWSTAPVGVGEEEQ